MVKIHDMRKGTKKSRLKDECLFTPLPVGKIMP